MENQNLADDEGEWGPYAMMNESQMGDDRSRRAAVTERDSMGTILGCAIGFVVGGIAVAFLTEYELRIWRRIGRECEALRADVQKLEREVESRSGGE